MDFAPALLLDERGIAPVLEEPYFAVKTGNGSDTRHASAKENAMERGRGVGRLGGA